MHTGLFKITEHRGYATIRCAPAYNDTFMGTSAYYDPDDHGWVIPTRRLGELIAYLENLGHDVIAERLHTPDPRVCPHGVLFGARILDGISRGGCNPCEPDWDYRAAHQADINTRGAATVRAALANAPHQGAP